MGLKLKSSVSVLLNSFILFCFLCLCWGGVGCWWFGLLRFLELSQGQPKSMLNGLGFDVRGGRLLC